MKLLSSVVCAVLIAGVSCATPTLVNRDAGQEYAFTVLAIGNTIATCHLKNPAGTTLDFIPEVTTQHENRYELVPISSSMPSCSVTVKNLQESDTGLWEVSFRTAAGTGNSQSFELSVSGSEIHEEKEIEDDTDDNVKWFNTIEFPTRTNLIIDISLPKINHEEECFVRTPNGDNLRASEVYIEGVTVYKRSSFVSCRITVGPMVEGLLGEWAVCGIYTENDDKLERCQPVRIYWNNVNRPETDWYAKTQSLFNHPVHLGYTLTPVVIGNGNPVSCHVITPNGEDLVIEHDSEYPGIKADTLAHSTCGIAIGPIDQSMLGHWTIYGIFRNSVSGLNEERLPFSMFLYDEENPFSQAYNVTVLDPVNRVVNLGNTLNVQVEINGGQVDSCSFKTPSGKTYNKHDYISFTGASFVEEDENTNTACRVSIGPITEELLGEWKITGKFSNDGLFTERQQIFRIIQEDPENPKEEDRMISYLSAQTVQTAIGSTHRLVIYSDVFTHAESCHIRTPNGLQFKIMEGFNVTGVKVIEESGVECGVIVNVVSEDVIGEWTLIARATRLSEAIERRLPFTIYVEESVEALASEIIVTEGNDLHIRLKYPTDQYKTCKLIGPFGVEYANAEPDRLHVETCGFIINDIRTINNGTWTITYGNRIVYKAEIAVTVSPGNTATDVPSTSLNLNLVRDRSVAQTVGPEDAVYCRLEDPQGFVVFDGFGRCNLTLDKVGLEHQGAWKMFVGVPGRVIAVESQMNVEVTESEGKQSLKTHVAQEKPIVTISCTVQTEAEVKACKFRDPQGKILLATSGVSEDRYTFHGTDVSYESEVTSRECGIRITNPLVTDLGMWRCAIETSEETYYGHLAVLCPWALRDPEVADAVQQEPILKADRSLVTVVEQEPAIMSCSVEATIRYCYFRASNGTTFSVTPGMSSSSMEYVGAGFDAGECGVKFHGLLDSDSGSWSCHVGIVGDSTEQRAQYQLTVHERMYATQYKRQDVMIVESIVYERRPLEYCRFVRIDGFGFTSDSVPYEYSMTGSLAKGECQLIARNPTILDLHPWTVAVRIRGQDVEITKDTMDAFMFAPPTTEPEGRQTGLSIFLYVFLCVMLLFILFGVCLGPKRHREWTHQRASAFRRSLSSSFRKQQLPTPAVTPNHKI